MDENRFRKVQAILKGKFYSTNDTWLRDCVEYYLSNHDNPNDTEVLDFVISQWQLSDLREISNESPCLPRNLAQEKCTILPGHFILQMEKVYDISESKYKQLDKIRNVSNDNIEITELEITQAWEPKKKRMLYLHLTDGNQNITAIEYRPIKFLNSNLLPGFKLMIKGPVTCRRGVILLDETNIAAIGGEVENLLVPNALENVLARALNLEENPEPYNDAIQSRNPEDALFEDDFDIDMEEVALIETQSQERAHVASSHDERNNRNSVSDEPANQSIEARREITDARSVPLNERTESDLLFDMIDDRIFETVTFPSVNVKSSSTSSVSSKNPKHFVSSRDSEILDEDNRSKFVVERTTSRSKTVEKPISIESISKRSIVQQSDDIMMLDIETVFQDSTSKATTSRSQKVEKPSSIESTPKRSIVEQSDDIEMSNVDTVSRDSKWNAKHTRERTPIVEDECLEAYREFDRQLSFENNTICNAPTVTPPLNIGRTEDFENLTMKRACNITSVGSSKVESNESTQTGSKRSASVLSSPMPNQPAGKVRCTKMTPKIDKVNRKITDFMKKDDSLVKEISNPKNVDNISDILTVIGTNNAGGYKTVRAKVASVDKLSKNDQCWELRATITDCTGNMDVEFSSEILERLLGLTVAEFSLKKKLKKTNPEIDNELRMGLRTAQNKLMTLNALLKILLAPNKRPKIVEIIETSNEQKKNS